MKTVLFRLSVFDCFNVYKLESGSYLMQIKLDIADGDDELCF